MKARHSASPVVALALLLIPLASTAAVVSTDAAHCNYYAPFDGDASCDLDFKSAKYHMSGDTTCCSVPQLGLKAWYHQPPLATFTDNFQIGCGNQKCWLKYGMKPDVTRSEYKACRFGVTQTDQSEKSGLIVKCAHFATLHDAAYAACADGLGAIRKKCDDEYAQDECSHVTCAVRKGKVRVRHHNGEKLGDAHTCAFDKGVGRCMCMCTYKRYAFSTHLERWRTPWQQKPTPAQ